MEVVAFLAFVVSIQSSDSGVLIHVLCREKHEVRRANSCKHAGKRRTQTIDLAAPFAWSQTPQSLVICTRILPAFVGRRRNAEISVT